MGTAARERKFAGEYIQAGASAWRKVEGVMGDRHNLYIGI